MNQRCLVIAVVASFVAGVLAPVTQAAEPVQADAAMPAGKADMVEKRIREKEPMSGGMKREGMMKEDVRMHAEKKDKKMDEAMKREQKEKEPAAK
jgi:hypothetical protein